MAKREYNEARKRANSRYEQQNVKRLTIKLNTRTDSDILEKLEEVPNKQGFVKKAIRDEIAREQADAQQDQTAEPLPIDTESETV